MLERHVFPSEMQVLIFQPQKARMGVSLQVKTPRSGQLNHALDFTDSASWISINYTWSLEISSR